MGKEQLVPNYEAQPELLIKIFDSPEFAQRMREILTLTGLSLTSSLRNGNELSTPEFGFEIDRKRDGDNFYIWPVRQGVEGSMIVPPDRAGISFLQLITLTLKHRWIFNNRKLLALVHFHEPWENPLIPSVYSEENQSGDLYGLFTFRKNESAYPSSYVGRKTIGIVGKVISPSVSEYPAEFLFYQEERADTVEDTELLEKLRLLQQFFLQQRHSLTQEDVVQELRKYGYRADYFVIPKEKWSQPTLFSGEQLERIAAFCH